MSHIFLIDDFFCQIIHIDNIQNSYVYLIDEQRKQQKLVLNWSLFVKSSKLIGF